MPAFRLAQKLSRCALAESWAGTQVQTDVDAGRLVTLHRLLGVDPGHPAAAALVPLVARSLARPDDPTLALLAVGTARESVWLVEEAADAGSLRGLVHAMAAQQARFQPSEGIAVFRELADALAALHAQEPPVVHGDVCSSTVMLTRDGLLRLSLSGVASALGSGAAGPFRAEVQALAPEQLAGVTSPATDCFRLGALLFEFVTGRGLFPTQDPQRALALARAHAGAPRELLEDIATPVATLLEALLHPDPAARPTALDARRVLDELAQAQRWPTGPAVIATLGEQFLPPLEKLRASGDGDLLALETLRASGVRARPSAAQPTDSVLATPGGVSIGRVTPRRVARVEARPPSSAARAVLGEGAQPPAPSRGSGGLKGFHIGPFLLARKQITSEQLEAAIAYAREYSIPLSDALVAIQAVGDEEMVAALGEFTRTPSIAAARLDKLEIAPRALALLEPASAHELCALPLTLKGQSQLVVAVRDPMDESLVVRLKGLCGVTSVVAMRASERALRRALRRCYGPSGRTAAETLDDEGGGTLTALATTPSAALGVGAQGATGRFPAVATALLAGAAEPEVAASSPDGEAGGARAPGVPLGASEQVATTGRIWDVPAILEEAAQGPGPEPVAELAVEPAGEPSPEIDQPARAPGVVALSALLSNEVVTEGHAGTPRPTRPVPRFMDSSRPRAPHGERLLVESLLQASGIEGRAARSFLQWIDAVARRLLLPQVEADRLWSAAAALVVANVVARRPPCTLTLSGVTEAAAQFGALWTTVGPLLNPLLSERRGPVTALGPALLDGAFALVTAVGRVPPRPGEVAPHLDALRGRLPASVVEALAVELGQLAEG